MQPDPTKAGNAAPDLAVGQVWSGTGTWCRIIDLDSPWPDMVTVETPKPRARKVPRPVERSYVPRKEFGTRLQLREEAS
jgi:isocitrate dehydrogenase kinase/phosphatase